MRVLFPLLLAPAKIVKGPKSSVVSFLTDLKLNSFQLAIIGSAPNESGCLCTTSGASHPPEVCPRGASLLRWQSSRNRSVAKLGGSLPVRLLGGTVLVFVASRRGTHRIREEGNAPAAFQGRQLC